MKRAVAIGVAMVISAILIIIGVVMLLYIYNRNYASGKAHAQLSGNSSEYPDDPDNFITKASTFPGESYALPFTDFENGTEEMQPLPVSKGDLSEAAIHLDDSSSVAEEGRAIYFYVRVPANNENNEEVAPVRTKRSFDTHVAGIGIRFGGSNNIRIFVLDAASPGLRLVRRKKDGSKIFRIRLDIPAGLCKRFKKKRKSFNTSETCHAIRWQPYSILSDRSIVASNFTFSNVIYLTCGPQCGHEARFKPIRNTHCAVSACRRCDGLQMSGANNPVTRRFDLGTNHGTFGFHYDTYKVPDRIRIWYQGQKIFDSGCVSQRSRISAIGFRGISSEVRVDVEPNCLGLEASTGWHFTVNCYSDYTFSAEKPSNDSYLLVGKGNQN